MARVYNFSAGPSTIAEPVLERAREEFMDWRGSGMSVLEMSHRGPEFVSIAAKTEEDLRDILGIPDHYGVLFLQGGATTQFSMVPMNLAAEGGLACYVDTGSWSLKAIEEARKICEVHIAASSMGSNYSAIPEEATWDLKKSAAYLHYTSNETIGGIEFPGIPACGGLPVVCDMSSNILSRPIEVDRFALIYAGAQKNMGAAGITVVIVRNELLARASRKLPSMLDYAQHAKNQSMLNTPPTFIWYLLGLVLDWIKSLGGLESLARMNSRKAAKLYQAIDDSSFYSNPIQPKFRSRMNIPFILADAALDERFLAEAEQEGLMNLKGHRSVGGMRASIYNAMPEAGVDRLVSFMGEFERRYG
ncbi:MAG: 3-phosphoserine/phosphohydroxythreonine transaminase [Methylococcaceae bacterium]|nr:3-phosphoserine/phosphohydroxythreonine transaminase [Methylococcaceae bacterium]MCI0732633.1 3-phosphoserine/phosphohydroxythreonine transaminase [Methylococcaceae bacterium]